MPTVGTTIKQYLSAITSMDQREILPEIVNIQNNAGLTDFMNAFGRYKPSKMMIYESFQNTPIWKNGVINATVGSPGATGTFVLTTGTSGGRRVNDQLMFKNGVNARVTAVTPGATDTIAYETVDHVLPVITSGENVKFFSNVVGERSINRQSLFFDAQRRYNLIQIFKDTHAESDVQKLSLTEVPSSGHWSIVEAAQMWMKLKAEVNAALFLGRISDSQFSAASPTLTDPEGLGQSQTTRGLDQYIESWGVKDTTATNNTWILADLDEMIAALVTNKTGNKYSILGATAPLNLMDNALKNLGSSGVTSARLNMDGRDVDYMIDRITKGGFVFQKSLLPILNQPELFGGTKVAGCLWYMPEGKGQTQNSEGFTTYEPFTQIRYKPVPRNSQNFSGGDIWFESHDGTMSPVNPNGVRDEARFSISTYQGLEVLGPEHFGRQQVTAAL